MFHLLNALFEYKLHDLIVFNCLPGPEEYCSRETFHGRCSEGEVIVMKSAMYGRMEVGKCVKRDLGIQYASHFSLCQCITVNSLYYGIVWISVVYQYNKARIFLIVVARILKD